MLNKLLLEFDLIRYIGIRFSCPICGRRFRKMKPYVTSFYIKGTLIDHYTENAICPKCGSDIRHRFGFTFLKCKTNLLKSNIKLLHVAPEEGIYYFLSRQKNIKYFPCDINPSGGMTKVDLTDIPFGDSSFGAFICNHVLEHIKDDVKAIAELYRILKPNGWGLITIPIYGETTFEDQTLDYSSREKMYGMGNHVRMNGLDFKLKLYEAGFLVDIYSLDDVSGNYVDRNIKSPHIESDKYLFFVRKAFSKVKK